MIRQGLYVDVEGGLLRRGPEQFKAEHVTIVRKRRFEGLDAVDQTSRTNDVCLPLLCRPNRPERRDNKEQRRCGSPGGSRHLEVYDAVAQAQLGHLDAGLLRQSDEEIPVRGLCRIPHVAVARNPPARASDDDVREIHW